MKRVYPKEELNDKESLNITDQGKVNPYILIKGFRCYRCAHEWRPRNLETKPAVCPKCKSPYWNKPKKSK